MSPWEYVDDDEEDSRLHTPAPAPDYGEHQCACHWSDDSDFPPCSRPHTPASEPAPIEQEEKDKEYTRGYIHGLGDAKATAAKAVKHERERFACSIDKILKFDDPDAVYHKLDQLRKSLRESGEEVH